MAVQQSYYAPIRLTEGREWISSSEISSIRDGAEVMAAETERKCGPSWAAVNPVVRIARINVVEVEE